MKFDLFITDYDGTLGNAPENNIDSETLEAINKFISKGGVFVVCSGRETSSITKILKENKLKGLVASFQGARISDLESGEYLFDGGLDAQTAVEILDDVAYSGLTPLAYTEDGLFYAERTPYVQVYENAVGLNGEKTDVKERIKKDGLGTSKLCWLGDYKIVNDVAEKMNQKYKGKKVTFNSGAKYLLEAINADCGKGQAVRFIANYYNIPLSKTITVGDSTNDIDLVKGEWHGVAVGDGREELKAVAKEITVPFKDKPIKTLLEKYCLND